MDWKTMLLIGGAALLLSSKATAQTTSSGIPKETTSSPISAPPSTAVVAPAVPVPARRASHSTASSGSWSNDPTSRTWSAPDAGTKVTQGVIDSYVSTGSTVSLGNDGSTTVHTPGGSTIVYF